MIPMSISSPLSWKLKVFIPGSFVTAGAVIAAGTGIYSAVSSADNQRKSLHAQQDALKGQQEKIDALQYSPIDLEGLKSSATKAAQENIAHSLALEQQFSPGVSQARGTLQKQIGNELALGGNVSGDVRNAVTSGGLAQAASAGLPGASLPLTAARLGGTAQDTLNQRQAKASALLAANPLPVSGLDPGSIASAMIADNNAKNQFAASKVGLDTNLVNSTLQVNSAGNAANTANNAALLNQFGTNGAFGSNGGIAQGIAGIGKWFNSPQKTPAVDPGSGE